MFNLDTVKELTDERLKNFLDQHAAMVASKYDPLRAAYETDYRIFHEEKKPEWKPDNRIAVNFAKYIVDTMNGFFIGIPIKITVSDDDSEIVDYIEILDKYNNQDDTNAELSKICSISGRGYEIYFVDEAGRIGITYLTPAEGFMVYDTSIIERPREFVSVYIDESGTRRGSVADTSIIRYFREDKGGIVWEEEKPHGFNDVPATEFKENEERKGLFEPAMSMIDAYNKAISEKANDVDYFADAYLKVLGAYLDEEDTKNIRRDRIINFSGESEKVIVDFLQKPNGDETQEHLIDRLERLIFMICMVANISDDEFGTQSGIAIKYKLLSMSNLAKTKERKFTAAINRRYKVIFSNEVSPAKEEDWLKINCHFTQNFPSNLLEQAQVAQLLEGIVSKETQLKILSVVESATAEIEKLKEEDAASEDRIMDELYGGRDDRK